jgi:hypothetical protein
VLPVRLSSVLVNCSRNALRVLFVELLCVGSDEAFNPLPGLAVWPEVGDVNASPLIFTFDRLPGTQAREIGNHGEAAWLEYVRCRNR